MQKTPSYIRANTVLGTGCTETGYPVPVQTEQEFGPYCRLSVRFVFCESWTPSGLPICHRLCSSLLWTGGVLVWWDQDYFSAFCRWRGPVVSIKLWSSALAGALCSRKWSGRDENQHLHIWDHGSQMEKGGTAGLGWSEVLLQMEEFKYLGDLFMSEGRMEQEINRRICCGEERF